MLPVFGSTFPMYPFALAVNHRLPSLSNARPWGPDPGVFAGYSLNSPVLGSNRPRTLANMPVHQIVPPGPGSGSWGREPRLGTAHSLIDTVTDPGITTAGGLGCSGKFLARYSATSALWSFGSATIVLKISSHPCRVYPPARGIRPSA